MLKQIDMIAVFLTILALFTIPLASHAGLDDKSLVLYLSFDEENGKTAKDGSQHGNDGELIAGPERVDGQHGGKAMEFDGTKSQYVKVPINDTLQLREQFSIAFWVKRGNTQVEAWNYMVSGGSLKWATIFNRDTQKTYIFTDAPPWGQRLITDINQPQDWVHIAVTHDTDSGVDLYYDGDKAGSGAKPPPVVEIDGSIMVGARHPGLEFFTGVIDEVFLFDRIITEAEINTLKDGDFSPVEPAEKLATTWGAIKTDRKKYYSLDSFGLVIDYE